LRKVVRLAAKQEVAELGKAAEYKIDSQEAWVY
jgi:hypothetical protein